MDLLHIFINKWSQLCDTKNGFIQSLLMNYSIKLSKMYRWIFYYNFGTRERIVCFLDTFTQNSWAIQKVQIC